MAGHQLIGGVRVGFARFHRLLPLRGGQGNGIHQTAFVGGAGVKNVICAVPQLAADQVGEIRIDWGDGRVNAVDCTISDGALTEMVNSPDKEALVESRHSYAATGKRTVKISSASGFLPLKSLPTQTVSIDSSLPVLTQGETDDKNQLIASDTLGRLVADNPESGQCTLSSICPELLANNPQLAFFDDAFAHSAISIVPPRLFAGCRKLSSLVRTFADSAVTQIPAGFLANADQSTICEETFAHCHALESIESPFKAGVLPVCMENFLLEAPSTFFSWCDPDRREEMGWVRPEAQSTDPSFDFEWMPTMVGVADGVLTGRFITKNCYGEEKVNRLLQLFPERTQYWLVAYGDSRGDTQLLDFANEGYYKPFG